MERMVELMGTQDMQISEKFEYICSGWDSEGIE